MTMFMEEKAVLALMLDRWYAGMEQFKAVAEDVFSEKGRLYDQVSPVWERISFPHGFVQELTKKVDRLKQLLANDGGNSNWAAVLEELGDIHNYAAMFASVIYMVQAERDSVPEMQMQRMYDHLSEWLAQRRKEA